MVAATMKSGLGSWPVPSALTLNTTSTEMAWHTDGDSVTIDEGAKSLLYVPSGHLLHFRLLYSVAFWWVYSPVPHLPASAHLLRPTVFPYLPSGHIVHRSSPPEEYFPLGHCVALMPSGQNDPGGHARHCSVETFLYCLGSQRVMCELGASVVPSGNTSVPQAYLRS